MQKNKRVYKVSKYMHKHKNQKYAEKARYANVEINANIWLCKFESMQNPASIGKKDTKFG